MLKNFVPSRTVERIECVLAFDDGEGNGYAFPCDMAGNLNLSDMSKTALENYASCMASPDKFVRFNEVVACRSTYQEPGHGTCRCGAEIQLWDQYYGACSCENCGRWYNLFGQSLLPPEQWELDPCEDEPW